MVFGTFDGLHDGHKKFFKEARKYGDYLVAVVAQDHIVEHIKGELPEINFIKRFEHLKTVDEVDEVIIGDAELSLWHVVDKHRPDVVAFGHDQDVLKIELENQISNLSYELDIKHMDSFEMNAVHGGVHLQAQK